MRHSLTRALPYTPAQLFALVGDVEAYPRFVPWVTRLTTSNRREDGPGVTCFDAQAEVGFAVVHERFSTRVRLDEPALCVDVNLIAGPFRRLENRWRFLADPAGSRLIFDIDFEFRSRLLDRLLAANFHRAVSRLIACFEVRAKVLYG